MCTMLSKWLSIYTIFLGFHPNCNSALPRDAKVQSELSNLAFILVCFLALQYKSLCTLFSHINKKTTFTDPRLAFAVEDKDIAGDMSTVKQKFDSYSTAQQVLTGRDLTGKYAIITGANAGIGMRNLRGEGCN
mgnify:CR=1 FL=1